MVSTLKEVIRDIGGDFQNAFIPGRLMQDNFFIAHKMLHWVKHQKRSSKYSGILKIDLSKAYDRIRWDFLKEVLQAYGFPDSWIRWISQCVQTVSYSVLVNGVPIEFFSPLTGLRQWDPLSPTYSSYAWKSYP